MLNNCFSGFSRNRISLQLKALLLTVAIACTSLALADTQPVVEVWKTPTCGCCGKWVTHMEDAGFKVRVTDLDNLDAVKHKHGISPALSSCHTAVVGNYVIEGHVPASDVRRLLKEHPDVLGLTAPGMPAGSPGMDIPDSPSFDVLAINKDGSTTVYSTHKP
ncbi:MAG: DUF411 domain-containing protein [Gammaproteobacteria bacterium]